MLYIIVFLQRVKKWICLTRRRKLNALYDSLVGKMIYIYMIYFFTGSSSSYPESETDNEKHSASPSEYLTPAPEFVISIGRKNIWNKVYYHDFFGNMISGLTAITFIPRVVLDV